MNKVNIYRMIHLLFYDTTFVFGILKDIFGDLNGLNIVLKSDILLIRYEKRGKCE